MRLLIISLVLSLLAGCAQNPVTGQNDFVMMSENQEIAVGRQNDEQVKKQYKVYESKALQDYVNGVGQRIAKQSHRPGLRYHFLVLDTPEINAFALPGGYVYITRGIMAYLNSEAELAAVLLARQLEGAAHDSGVFPGPVGLELLDQLGEPGLELARGAIAAEMEERIRQPGHGNYSTPSGSVGEPEVSRLME